MKEDLFKSTLLDKAKAANNNAPIDNLSERTISEVVTMFLPMFADDEKITDESWTLPVQMVKTLSGQLRHDTSTGINDFKTKFVEEQKTAQAKAIADAIAAAKAEWEKKNPKNEPNPNEPPKNEPDIAKLVSEKVTEQMKALTGEDSEFGKLSKQFSDYLKAQAAKDKAAAEASVRDQIKEYLLGRGVEEDDYALEITLEKLVIGDNPDVSVLKTKAEKDYEAIYKRMHKNDGAQPFAGGGGGGEVSGAKKWLEERGDVLDQESKSAEARKKLLQ